MRYLALLLLGPWLVILAWAYWSYPKSLPQRPARRAFDAIAVLLATAAAIALAAWGHDSFAGVRVDQLGTHSGGIWQQVAPVLYAYGGFATVMIAAMLLRSRLWKSHVRTPASHPHVERTDTFR